MDLQIPTAAGKDNYVIADLLFEDPDGLRISYGVGIYSKESTHQNLEARYDAPSNSYLLNAPLGTDQRFVTAPPTGG
jgi:hypothetical protein